jgi:hypothetical protein
MTDCPLPGERGWYCGEPVTITAWETLKGEHAVHAVRDDGSRIRDDSHMFERELSERQRQMHADIEAEVEHD